MGHEAQGLNLLGSWLLSYLLHSSVLLIAAWALERRFRQAATREALWRWALFGALLSASVQLLLPQLQPSPQTPPTSPTSVAQAPPQAPEPWASAERPLPTPVSGTAIQLPGPALPWAAAVSLAWAAVAAAGLLLTLARWAGLRRQARRLPLLQDLTLGRLAEALARRAGVPPPALRLSPDWPSPLVAPGGAICLPAWALQRLNTAQLETVLAHEVAHLRRRDPAWRLAGQLLAKLAWLQPLNALALRRLDLLAELACDDWAARQQSSRLALAESLCACAEQLARRPHPMPGLVSAIAAGRSPLMQRISQLLEQDAMQDEQTGHHGRRQRRLIAAAVILLAALGLPLVMVSQAKPGDWAELGNLLGRLVPHNSNSFTSQGPGGKLKIQFTGKLQFSPAEDELLSIGQGGALLLEETNRDGLRRSARFEADAQGRLQRSYAVNGQQQAPDAAGQAWLGEMIALASEASQGSMPRMKRLLARGGTELVLADIAQARDDFTRRGRIEAFSQLGAQSNATLERLLALARAMGSDFERRAALEALIRHQAMDPGLQQRLLGDLRTLGSDFERRQVLDALTPSLAADGATLQAWVTAATGMGSAFELRAALEALVRRGEADSAYIDAALQASLKLDSDFEHRSALESIAAHWRDPGPAQLQAFAVSARGIASDFDRREALMALLRHGGQDRTTALAMLDAMPGMQSSFDQGALLTALAAHMPGDAELLARYRQQARGLDDFERGQTERAIDHLQARR